MIYTIVLKETFETTQTFDRPLANYFPQDQSYCAYLALLEYSIYTSLYTRYKSLIIPTNLTVAYKILSVNYIISLLPVKTNLLNLTKHPSPPFFSNFRASFSGYVGSYHIGFDPVKYFDDP